MKTSQSNPDLDYIVLVVPKQGPSPIQGLPPPYAPDATLRAPPSERQELNRIHHDRDIFYRIQLQNSTNQDNYRYRCPIDI